MKLYHFNPNDYGMEWYVMSDSEENAIKALSKHLKEDEDYPSQWSDYYFKRYTIDVYDVNQVIESEIA